MKKGGLTLKCVPLSLWREDLKQAGEDDVGVKNISGSGSGPAFNGVLDIQVELIVFEEP